MPAKTQYPAHKLEFHALKWAVTDKFYDKLDGRSFSVLTDNNPQQVCDDLSQGRRYRPAVGFSAFHIRLDFQYLRGHNNMVLVEPFVTSEF